MMKTYTKSTNKDYFASEFNQIFVIYQKVNVRIVICRRQSKFKSERSKTKKCFKTG